MALRRAKVKLSDVVRDKLSRRKYQVIEVLPIGWFRIKDLENDQIVKMRRDEFIRLTQKLD